MGDKDPRKPQSPFRFPSLVNYQPERNTTPHPQHRQTRLPPPKTPRRYPTIYEDQPNDRRLRPLSRHSGKRMPRTTQENLLRRDQERLDAILNRKQQHQTLADNSQRSSQSDTTLFQVPKRSVQIIEELCNAGFIARHRYGGLGYDVSLGGRPVRLSPIGASSRRPKRGGGGGGYGKKRKKSQQGKGGKRTKRDKKGKKNRGGEHVDSGVSGRRSAGSDVEYYEDSDWEDLEEEEEEEE